MADILTLIAQPFDPAVSVALSGPPAPFGVLASGDEISGWSYSGAATSVYLAEDGYVSAPADTPANTEFRANLVAPFAYRLTVFEGAEPAGETRPGLGAIRVANGDGSLDGWLDYGWDGRAVRIYRGDKGAAFSAHSLVFNGTCDGLDWDLGGFTIRLRDLQAVFARDVHTTFYSGSGGYDGGADLAGLGRPLTWGSCLNVAGVLIDAANAIYQIHDGAVQAISAVRDNGVALSLDTTVGASGDVATYALLAAASVGAAKYATCEALGLVKLGTEAVGQVTMDVEGETTGGYVATTGTIVRRIVTTRLGAANLNDPTDLDTAAFAQMETDQSATVGYHVGADAKPAAQILDELMTAVAGYWFRERDGAFTLAVLKAPSGTAASSVGVADLALDRPVARRGILPSYRRRVGYQRVWAVQPADGLAGGVAADDRAFYSQDYRYAEALDSNVRARHRLARDVLVPAFFATQAAAETEAARQQALFGTRRDVYDLPIAAGDLFGHDVGAVIEIAALGRFGFAAAEKALIVGVEVDAQRRELLLKVWL